jgi:hypothetical protein
MSLNATWIVSGHSEVVTSVTFSRDGLFVLSHLWAQSGICEVIQAHLHGDRITDGDSGLSKV